MASGVLRSFDPAFAEAVDHEVLATIRACGALARMDIAADASSGQRLRALFVRLGCGPAWAHAGSASPAVASAAAVELLHLGTLVQDDVLDRSPRRRGRPSLWVRHGEDRAIVTGDLLYALAFQCAGHVGSTIHIELAQAFEAVCAGQLAEFDAVGCPDRALVELEDTAIHKTAALFAAALVIGRRSTGDIADRRSVASLRAVGRSFGLAYQLFDDLQDVDRSNLTVGADAKAGLATSPWLLGAQRGPAPDADVAMEVRALWEGPGPAAAAERLRDELARCRSLALDALSGNEAHALGVLCRTIDHRTADLVDRNRPRHEGRLRTDRSEAVRSRTGSRPDRFGSG